MSSWVGSAWGACASQHRRPADAATGHIVEGEAALAGGDPVAASEAFERAGAMRHSPAGEMGSVRASMQLGEYARALALAAHVEGEHLDEPGAALLHAWLLRVGDRAEIADRALRDARTRVPDDPLVAAALRAFASPWPIPAGPMLVAPHRVAPFATFAPGEATPPSDASVLSSGVLLPGGRHVLGPRRPEAQLWIRDGLGATRVAKAVAADEVSTLYRLDAAIVRSGDVADFGEPRAGTPAFTAHYAESATAEPAWPWLRAGFLGASTRAGDGFRLGIDLAAGRGGGPVLDRAGRLVGIVLRDDQGRATARPASHWPGTDARARPSSEKLSASDLSPDRIYERAMRTAVQVIAVA